MAESSSTSPAPIYLKDYTPPEYWVGHVDLTFLLEAENTKVNSRIRLQKNRESSCNDSAPLVLSGENLSLQSVKINGQLLTPNQYELTPETLTIPSAPKVEVFILEIENSINPKQNTALEGLYLSSGLLCTQCEAQGFRKITYFPDRPDVMSTFSTLLIADKDLYPVLLSNGNKISTGELKNNRHWVKWEDPVPKPCYLFALVAGQLSSIEDHHLTPSGRNVCLQIYVEPHDIDKCSHAMSSLKQAMLWDEKVYGLEYDLDLYMIVAVSHFNMGAMENKGLNVFNTKFVLARPDTATDSDYEHIQGVIAHEYFHNWTGNRITCRDWFQLSLKEGFTVFRDQEFSADHTSRAVKRIEDVNLLRTRQFVEDAGPLAHPIRPDSYIEINNFYTLTVYEKGAEVVRMINTLLGPAAFRSGCDLYFARHDGKAVTCDDFVAAMEDAGGIDLKQFKLWYSQAGTPELTLSSEYDAHQKTLALNIEQQSPATPGQAVKKPLHIPLSIGLIAPDGSDYPLRLADEAKPGSTTRVLDITETRQSFQFIDLPEKPVISALRGFSAPVKLHQARGLDELAFLLANDSDSFNRWDAGQSLAGLVILDKMEKKPENLTSKLIEAYRKVLRLPEDDLSYIALLLALPSEDYIGASMKCIDPEAIYLARNQVKKEIAQALAPEFMALYLKHHRDDSECSEALAIGRRRLKNNCLDYLSQLDSADVQSLCVAQFKTAKNMTDQIAALSCIVNSQNPEKPACLDSFYQQWKAEELVIDKWFAIQASCHLAGTLDEVQRLLNHPAFDLKTPNRVRALIGSFCQFNSVRFHALDGAGYRFLADHVILLNALNPQVASRMITPLTQWRRYDETRQALMLEQLQRISKTEGISSDVFEVLSKSLA